MNISKEDFIAGISARAKSLRYLAESPRSRACTYCGELGHNVRKCPKRGSSEMNDQDEVESLSTVEPSEE